MTTEQDIIFDNLYEDVALKLDSILDEVIADIEDEWGINNDLMMKIVETWSVGVSARLPLANTINRDTMQFLKKMNKKVVGIETNKNSFVVGLTIEGDEKC
tara:strand:- start:1345 stop:1647 length:303 start_codon:yes stop_codon:yes gene_type:complete